jgi:hypothetical protein
MSVRDNIRVLNRAVKLGGFSVAGRNTRPSAAVVGHPARKNGVLGVGFSTVRPDSCS